MTDEIREAFIAAGYDYHHTGGGIFAFHKAHGPLVLYVGHIDGGGCEDLRSLAEACSADVMTPTGEHLATLAFPSIAVLLTVGLHAATSVRCGHCGANDRGAFEITDDAHLRCKQGCIRIPWATHAEVARHHQGATLEALQAFVDAATALDRAWSPVATDDALNQGYPSFLPSFDEALGTFIAWRDAAQRAAGWPEGRLCFRCMRNAHEPTPVPCDRAYTLDGAPLDIADFVTTLGFDAHDLAELARLAIDEELHYDAGGVLRRIR